MTRILFASVLALAVGTRGLADWSQFQGDSRHTGYAAGNFDVQHFYQKWQLQIARATDIAIQGNALYVTQAGLGFESEATVSRIDLFSGAIQWSTNLAYQSPYGVSAPAVQDDTVYVHRWGHSGSSGSTAPTDKPALVGLDANSGAQLFATQHSGQWNSGSRPTVLGDAVFSAGGYYGGLDAYGLNGSHKWFAKVNQQYGWIPAADAHDVYVYMGEASASPGPSVGKLYIANRQTGALRSIDHPRSTGTRSRTSDDGSVMLDDSGNAYALSRVSGSSTLVSFDTLAGRVKWEADGFWSDNPATANGIIALPEAQSLVFLDAGTGVRLWSWNHSATVRGNVLLTDDFAFVNTDTGIFAIDLDSRKAVWNTSVTGKIAATDSTLFVTSENGIYAFSAVPEPASGFVIGVAIAMLICFKRPTRSS